jgi:hypothetical protein
VRYNTEKIRILILQRTLATPSQANHNQHKMKFLSALLVFVTALTPISAKKTTRNRNQEGETHCGISYRLLPSTPRTHYLTSTAAGKWFPGTGKVAVRTCFQRRWRAKACHMGCTSKHPFLTMLSPLSLAKTENEPLMCR